MSSQIMKVCDKGVNFENKIVCYVKYGTILPIDTDMFGFLHLFDMIYSETCL